MSAHEKAAGVLDTPATAHKTTPTEFTSTQQQEANLIARFERAGHAVHRGQEQAFTVVHVRHGMSRYCTDFAELQAFAKLVGVKS